MKKARRGFYALKDIRKGEVFSNENIRELRPRAKVGPEHYKQLFGKKALKNIKKNQAITRSHVS